MNKYTKQISQRLNEIKEYAKEGLSDKEIAKRLLISSSLFSLYKKRYSDLEDALNQKNNKPSENELVEKALLKRATGQILTEKSPIKLKKIYYDEQGRKCEEEAIEIIETQKLVPGDVSAAKFWLTHRAPSRWGEQEEGSEGLLQEIINDISEE
jgi:transposase